MTEYIILAFCVIILLAYFFDLSSRFSKIPGVILLIALGMLIQFISETTGFDIPNLQPLLPVLGTLGLIMIVMEASLDIELKKSKKGIIIKSVSSAFILFAVFTALATFVLVKFLGLSVRDALLNSIPFGIISSAIAIPSAAGLKRENKEFIVYESSFSDIFGIMAFDFILFNSSSLGMGLFMFLLYGLITVVIALIATALLGYLLHKTSYHVNYVIIITFIVLIYSLAKLVHLPALLLILIFGLALANNRFLEKEMVMRFIDFPKFRNDISSFRKILGELTFLIRSFFFIMFGFYTPLNNLLSPDNILIALAITAVIFLLRWLFFRLVLRMPAVPMVMFAPRGLITILLFLSIPASSSLGIVSEEVVTLVIFLTIIVMTLGNFLQKKEIPVAVNEQVPSGQADLSASQTGS
jgi:Kef-type K+ transport system membrane component KefB